MEIITSKSAVNALMADAMAHYDNSLDDFVAALYSSILQKKIRFPLLEHAAVQLYSSIPDVVQIEVVNKIIALHTLRYR